MYLFIEKKEKKYMENKIKPDEYQQKAIDWTCFGTGNLLLEARAGSGKTKTIIDAIMALPRSVKILYLAFNKSIADTSSSILEGLKNVKVSTYHAQGLSMITKYFHKGSSVDSYKYLRYLTENLQKLSNGFSDTLTDFRKERYKKTILTLFDFSRYNLAQNYKEINKVAQKYDINIIYNEIDVVIKLLEWGQEHIEELDFPDMIWIPCEQNIDCLSEKYDFVFVDEVQDSSPAQQMLFQKCMKSNARCMMVGDPQQCINEWCGSDSKAFVHLSKLSNTINMKLPISYRCSRSIINTVNEIVKDIRPRPNAQYGRSGFFIHPEELRNGDGVLCRNNEPLIRLYIQLIKAGKTALIIGKSLGKELKDLVRLSESDVVAMDFSTKGIIPNLYYNFFEEVVNYSINKNITFEDALSENKYKNLLDNIKAIECIAENAKTKEEFYQIVDNAFCDIDSEEISKEQNKKRITLSSIHKSKGLEFERVFEACPSMCPSKLAKTPEEKEAEANLFYVCVTRGKSEFGYIYESDLRPSLSWNTSNAEKAEIKNIKKKVEALYGPIKVTKINNRADNEKTNKVIEKPLDENTKKKGVKFKKFL